MVDHPLQRLGVKPLAIAMVALTVSVVLLSAILVYAVPPSARSQINDLLQAESATSANAILASWKPDVFRTFAFLLGFDFLYDLVHNNCVAVFVIWGAKRVDSIPALRLASATAWVLWLDSALNVFENLVFLNIVRAAEASSLLQVASAIFSFRTVSLGLGFLIGLGLHTTAFWRRHASAV